MTVVEFYGSVTLRRTCFRSPSRSFRTSARSALELSQPFDADSSSVLSFCDYLVHLSL